MGHKKFTSKFCAVSIFLDKLLIMKAPETHTHIPYRLVLTSVVGNQDPLVKDTTNLELKV